MRFLADENFPGAAVEALRIGGHDVVWVRIEMPSSADSEVLKQAAQDGCILLTFDKDFGELAKASALPPSCGVVLLRILMPKSDEVGRRLSVLISTRDDWAGYFSVVEPSPVRMRPLR